MAVATGPCPNCGSTIEFKAGSSVSLVCKYCKSVVVRTDRDMRNLGKIADVAFSDAGLAPGDRGTFRGRSFSVEGRLVLQHPQGGTWEEYYALFGSTPTWISEAQGFWQVVSQVQFVPPPLQSIAPMMQVNIQPHGVFTVQEKNTGTFISGEGELPFAAAPGTPRVFVDLSAPNGGWASIDYGDGSAQPQVFVGVQTSFAEFQIQQRGGDRAAPGAQIKTADIKCPACGAPQPVLSKGAERIACRHCNAISDIKLQQVVAQQSAAREQPGMELGRKGVLPVADARGIYNAEWTVLGYVERSTGYPGGDDWFGWQEYLLYNEQHGYRWLVYDEGKFLLVTPLSAGDIDASRAPVYVVMRNIHFRRRNAQQARVDFVLGEFYWKVQVGETVQAEDYEHGREIISCERSATEVNWSHGVVIPTQVVMAAFGWQPKASAYGAAPAYGGSTGTSSGSPPVGLIVAIIIIVIFLIFVSAACDACDGGGSSGGSTGIRGVGSSSGFGGK